MPFHTYRTTTTMFWFVRMVVSVVNRREACKFRLTREIKYIYIDLPRDFRFEIPWKRSRFDSKTSISMFLNYCFYSNLFFRFRLRFKKKYTYIHTRSYGGLVSNENSPYIFNIIKRDLNNFWWKKGKKRSSPSFIPVTHMHKCISDAYSAKCPSDSVRSCYLEIIRCDRT